jgi:hypothetical protein
MAAIPTCRCWSLIAKGRTCTWDTASNMSSGTHVE